MCVRWLSSSLPIEEEKKEEVKKKKILIYEDFSDEKIIYLALKTMMVIQYLHSKDVAFIDLKPDNILIFRNWQVKLGDFGGAIKLRNDIQEYHVYSCTPYYASKEFYDKY